MPIARRAGIDHPDGRVEGLPGVIVAAIAGDNEPGGQQHVLAWSLCGWDGGDREELCIIFDIQVEIPAHKAESTDILAAGVPERAVLLLVVVSDSLPGV